LQPNTREETVNSTLLQPGPDSGTADTVVKGAGCKSGSLADFGHMIR